MPGESRRSYNSSRRRELARTTEARILDAACARFVEAGYAATSMADIAGAAGVAVQTIYNVIGGGKAAVFKRVWDVTIAGDNDPVPLTARAEVRALLDDPVPTSKLHRYAALSRHLYQRLGPLARVLRAGAAGGDHDLVRLLETVESERLRGATSIAAHIADVGALRPDLTIPRAGQRLWVIIAGETGDALVVHCGWDLDEYQAWMADTMTSSLLQR